MKTPADYNWEMMGPDGGLMPPDRPLSDLVKQRDRPDDSCFLSIRFPDDTRLTAPGALLDGVRAEVTPPEHFHLTLLVAEQCSDDQLALFLGNLSPSLPFSLEVTGLKLIDGTDSKVLVWSVDPGPALGRLQSELYNAVVNEDMVISPYSKPGAWLPHITLAYILDNSLRSEDLPQIEPFRLIVNSFTIGRSYDDYFEVNLPRGMGDDMFVQRHGRHSGQQGRPGGGSQPGFTHAEGSWVGHIKSVKKGGGSSKLFLAEEAGIDPAGGKYVAVCDEHGSLCNFTNKKTAVSHMQVRDWCEECMTDAEVVFDKVERDRNGMKITVTLSDLSKLIHGGQIVKGVLRRMVGIEDGPFAIERADSLYAPTPTFGGAGQGSRGSAGGSKQDGSKTGMKKQDTGFNADGKKQKWGLPYHRPVELSLPSNEDLQELMDAIAEWEGDGRSIVDELLHEEKKEPDPVGELIETQIIKWFDNPDDEDIPITPDQMFGMEDGEIQKELEREADALIEDRPEVEEREPSNPDAAPTLLTQDSVGRKRVYTIARDNEEIVAIIVTTMIEEDDYRLGLLADGAQIIAYREDSDKLPPTFLPEHYVDESFETSYLFVDWLAVKHESHGFGRQMLGEIFRQAAETKSGVYLEATDSAGAFYEKFFVNTTDDDTLFWTAEEVEEWAETVKEETEAFTSDELVQREDISEVAFGTDQPELRPVSVDDDTEPLDGGYTIGNMLWSKRPRPWKRQFRDQIEEASFMTDEDAAILDNALPADQRFPDERETMLQGVQRALDNLVRKLFKKRHGEHVDQAGEEGRRGGSQAGFTHAEGSVEGGGGGGADTESKKKFDRLSKVLKRILGKRMEVTENPVDAKTYAEIRDQQEDWDGTAASIVDGWLNDVQEQSNINNISSQGDLDVEDAREIDYEALSEIEHEYNEGVAQPEVERISESYDEAVDSYYSENNIDNWSELEAQLMEDYDLSESDIRAMGSQEIHNLVGNSVSLRIFEDEGFIEEGEYEQFTDISLPSGGTIGGDYGDELLSSDADVPDRVPTQVSEMFNQATWEFVQDDVTRSTTTAELEGFFGGLPRLGEDGDSAEAQVDVEGGFDVVFNDNQYAFVGRENGEIVAVLSATIQTNNYKTGENYIEALISRGDHVNMRLSEGEARDLIDAPMVSLNYLAAKRGGAGHGTEMILRGLNLAAENDAGIFGNSVPGAASFYTKLGARWLDPNGAEKGGPAVFTPSDVKNLIGWLDASGLSFGDTKPSEELQAASLALLMVRAFDIDALSDWIETEDPSGHFTKVSDKQAIIQDAVRGNDQWVDKIDSARPYQDLLNKRHGKHIDQAGEEGRRGGSTEGFEHEKGSVEGGGASDKENGSFAFDKQGAEKWGRENFQDTLMNLMPAELQALADFKTHSYKDVNAYLREDPETLMMGDEEIEEAIETIDGIMEKSSTPEDVVAFRGMDLEDQFERNFDDLEGEIIRFDGYTSTTLNVQTLRVFVDEPDAEEPPVVLEIRVPKGTPSIWMDDQIVLSRVKNSYSEQELLLDRGLKFRVVEVGTTFLTGQEVRSLTVEVVPGSGYNHPGNLGLTDIKAEREEMAAIEAGLDERAGHDEKLSIDEEKVVNGTSQDDDTSQEGEDNETSLESETDEDRRDYWIWEAGQVMLMDMADFDAGQDAAGRQTDKFSKDIEDDDEEEEETVERAVVGPLRRIVIVRHGKHVDQAGEEGQRGGSQAGFTHEEGSVEGGGGGSKKVVGITSAKTGKEGEKLVSDEQVLHDMREFEAGLKSIKTVKNVQVGPARGIFFNDVESSWAVSYEGDGQAESLIQQTVDEKNQEMAIIWDDAGDDDYMIDYTLRKPVTASDLKVLDGMLEKANIPGGTWLGVENGQRVFRSASAVEIEGSMSKDEYRSAASVLSDIMKQAGYDHTTEDLDVVAKVIRRSE